MKKIWIIMASLIVAAALFSCKGDSLEPENPEPPALFKVNPNSLTFGYNDKDTQTVYIAALNVEWEAEVEASAREWLTITEESDKITISVEELLTEDTRAGKITITSDNEALDPVEVIVVQTFTETLRIPMNAGLLAFDGDGWESGFSKYVISLGDGDAWVDPPPFPSLIIHNGYKVVFNLLTEEVVHRDYQIIELKPGIYNIGMNPADERFEYEKMSFIRTNRTPYGPHDEYYQYTGSMISEINDGVVLENMMLTEGRIVVEKEDDNYIITADLVTDRNQRIVVEYSGPFDVRYNSISYSTYTADRDLTGFNYGALVFWGEQKAIAPGTNYWVVSLEIREQNITMNKLELDLISPRTDSLILDDGEYSILGKYPYTEFESVPGFLYMLLYPYGNWIHEARDIIETGSFKMYSPLIEGTATVKHNGGENYTITVDMYMDNYYKLTASYEGDLKYIYNGGWIRPYSEMKGVPYKLENTSEIPRLSITPQKTDQGPFPPVPER